MSDASPIATSSIEEGLDFAFKLLIAPVAATGRANPALAVDLLEQIVSFVHPRYAGEPVLALDCIEHLATMVSQDHLPNAGQIERQLKWLRQQITR